MTQRGPIDAEVWQLLISQAKGPGDLEILLAGWLGQRIERGRSSAAQEVLAIRQRLGMSQRELAKAAGVSQPDLSKWERGVMPPSLKSMQKIRALAASQELAASA